MKFLFRAVRWAIIEWTKIFVFCLGIVAIVAPFILWGVVVGAIILFVLIALFFYAADIRASQRDRIPED